MNPEEAIKCNGVDCFENDYFVNNFKLQKCPHVHYRGLAIEQHAYVIRSFMELLSKTSPKRVIEIGTFHGGLTLIIKDILNSLSLDNTAIYTYDINNEHYLEDLVNQERLTNINIYKHNLFSGDYLKLIDNNIQNIISDEGTTILLCDGGCKKCEFNLLSEYLKSGDIIMAHDYAPNKEYFEEHMRDKIWNWHEIQDSDIQDSIINNNLQPYMREEFLTVAWACFQKL